ncbi:MAG: hypothetical protein R3Y63_13475 [Eubacteriales bacterium]
MDYVLTENYNYVVASIWFSEDNEYSFGYETVWLPDSVIYTNPELETKQLELLEIIAKYSYESTGKILLYDEKTPMNLSPNEKYLTLVLNNEKGQVKTMTIYEDGLVRAGDNHCDKYEYYMVNARSLIDEVVSFLAENPELEVNNFTAEN